VAFLKFSRDRRGYEHFYLVEPTTRRGKTRPRVLYWFRTPPNIKVGREPFDDDARRSLQAQNPGVTFDWRRILDTPVPSPDVEMWRERRRAEKAVRRAALERGAERDDRDAPDDTIAASDAVPDKAPSASPPLAEGQSEQVRRRRRRGRRGRSRDAQGADANALSGEPSEPHDLSEHPGSIEGDNAGERRERDERVESSDPTSDQ
jgi:hypothetical protein